MTHNELLELIETINTWLSIGQIHKDHMHGMAKALRAVVELHKPHNEDSKYCAGCEVDDPWYWNDYPCPTIQAIEKELR